MLFQDSHGNDIYFQDACCSQSGLVRIFICQTICSVQREETGVSQLWMITYGYSNSEKNT